MIYDYQKSTVELLRDIVEAMVYTIEVEGVTVNMDGTQTLQTCNIFYAEIGRKVTINGIERTITAISGLNKTITVSGSGAIAIGDSFQLYPVYFFHGTPRATNIELNKQNDAAAKTPMVWLSEVFSEDGFNQNDARDRTVNSDGIFFLTQANHDQWQTDEAYHKAIYPMRRLYYLFIDELKKRPGLFYTVDMKDKTEAYAKFGVYIRDKGVENNLFADKLAGVRLQAPIVINKTFECLC